MQHIASGIQSPLNAFNFREKYIKNLVKHLILQNSAFAEPLTNLLLKNFPLPSRSQTAVLVTGTRKIDPLATVNLGNKAKPIPGFMYRPGFKKNGRTRVRLLRGAEHKQDNAKFNVGHPPVTKRGCIHHFHCHSVPELLNESKLWIQPHMRIVAAVPTPAVNTICCCDVYSVT